jgi:hypothetical protein
MFHSRENLLQHLTARSKRGADYIITHFAPLEESYVQELDASDAYAQRQLRKQGHHGRKCFISVVQILVLSYKAFKYHALLSTSYSIVAHAFLTLSYVMVYKFAADAALCRGCEVSQLTAQHIKSALKQCEKKSRSRARRPCIIDGTP